LIAGRLFSLNIPVSSTNKAYRYDIIEILLKVALNTITLTPNARVSFIIIRRLEAKLNIFKISAGLILHFRYFTLR
jgi:hypothetical protein